MIKFEGALIRKKYVGYAYIQKAQEGWRLHVRFMNDNKEKDGIWFNYMSEREAYEKFDELEKLLNE